MMKKRWIWIMVFMLLFLTGCKEEKQDKKVVLTAGFEKNEIFRIESMSCSMPEIMIYLVNTQNQYESTFGKEIWQANLEGTSLEESVKENVLAQLSQIKTMNLLAKQHGVVLEEEELLKVKEVAQTYWDSLSPHEIETLNVSQELLEAMYAEYALADKVYEYIIKDINPEISDDEARTITIQHILFKTYELDGTGQKIEYSEKAKKEAYRQAQEVLKLARQEGNDFEALIMEYSEDEKGTYSFGKGEMEPAFEEAAFNLETGEISDIIETAYGYHIIKCMNTFNREETDSNKVKIVAKKREEVFGQEYEAFVATLTKVLNEELWGKVTLVSDEEITTENFFHVYEDFFEEE